MVCFFFSTKKVVCCGVLFDSSSSIIAFVANQTTWQIGNTHEIHRVASDMLLVTCTWRFCRCRSWALHGVSGVPIGALLVVPAAVAFGCVLFVARFWLAEVG